MNVHPFAHESTQNKATLWVAGILFVLTLSSLNSVGLVPDYVDGTGTFARDSMVTDAHAKALPNEEGQLALNDIPRLGEEVVLAPLAENMATPGVQPLGQPIMVETPIKPTRIVIHAIGKDLPISNPESTEVAALDDALLSSVVRYPLSAELNQDGNVFIFGHSSHLPVVKNQMFKAFNDLELLEEGDTIKLIGEGESHIYRVSSVKQVDANEALIDLSVGHGKRLTLSTCDSFGGKSSRWVVEADFVGSYQDTE